MAKDLHGKTLNEMPITRVSKTKAQIFKEKMYKTTSTVFGAGLLLIILGSVAKGMEGINPVLVNGALILGVLLEMYSGLMFLALKRDTVYQEEQEAFHAAKAKKAEKARNSKNK